jgi:hypothetical protein
MGADLFMAVIIDHDESGTARLDGGGGLLKMSDE